MLNTESRLLDLGRAGFGKACGVADALRLEAVLAERGDLSLEQAAMVRSLCSSGNGVEVVIGVPGSGKTFALDVARRAWQSSGYRVYGAALVAEAAAQLEAGSQISSVTSTAFSTSSALRRTCRTTVSIPAASWSSMRPAWSTPAVSCGCWRSPARGSKNRAHR